ncbi:hypothetical protein FB451DRAFT_1399712 [Mycena latifolia]|nr:hypothetical protein FB451DRAFT_1399712 [Mycena latifolia]
MSSCRRLRSSLRLPPTTPVSLCNADTDDLECRPAAMLDSPKCRPKTVQKQAHDLAIWRRWSMLPNCSAHAFHSMIATDWPSIASSVWDCRRPRRGVRAVVDHREDQNAIRVGKTKID